MKEILSNLAILAIYHNDKKNYIESFVPFFISLVNEKKYKSIDVKIICDDFKTKFGLSIPQHPMSAIIDKAYQNGFLIKKSGIYAPDIGKVTQTDFESTSLDQQRKFEKILVEFETFCSAKFGHYVDRTTSYKTFLYFLKNYDLQILFATKEASCLPEIKDSVPENTETIYLINKFIIEMAKSEPENFKFIVDIAIGHIVASAILYSSEIINCENKNIKINIYFDTPFVLALLGFDGERLQEACIELIRNLKEQGAKLFVFKHNYEEINGLLRYCKEMIDSPYYRADLAKRILIHFKHKGYKKFDIEKFEVTLLSILQEHKIDCVDPPSLIEHKEYHINEENLFKIINDYYREHDKNYNEDDKKYTIQKDVDSIVAINNLRRNHLPSKIRDAGHIFVTPNYTLAKLNREFEKKHIRNSFFIPACVTDIFIGTVFWLNSPVKFSALNQKKLIADCYASLKPNAEIRKKIIDEAEILLKEKRISSHQYILLRESEVIEELVMDKTQGNPDKFIPTETITNVLENFEEISDRKYREEKNDHDKTKSEKEFYKRSLYQIFNFFSHLITIIIYVPLIVIFTIGVYYAQIQNIVSNQIFKIVLILLYSAVFIFSICTNLLGFTLKYKNIKQRIFVNIRKKWVLK